ncbi:unnamed protein product [Closterium sp. Yama58-4]|nr:unnamed protein product [Closterium sp. Yama58-4]
MCCTLYSIAAAPSFATPPPRFCRRIRRRVLRNTPKSSFAVMNSIAVTSIAASQPSIPFALPSRPLISASDTWGVWAALLAAAAVGFWSERHTDLGRALSGPLVATLVGLAASNLGLIPSEAPVYGIVNRFLLPLAVPLLLFAADLRRVIKDTGRLLLAFCVGSVGTIFGTLVAFAALPLRSLGGDGWKIAAALMGRHIGGAVNYVAVTEALQASPSVVTAALAADNLLCALHFTTLFALAASIPAEEEGESSGAADATATQSDSAASTVSEHGLHWQRW